MMYYGHWPFIAELLAWLLLVLILGATLTLTILGIRRRDRALMIAAASGLLLALVIAVLWQDSPGSIPAMVSTLLLVAIGVVGGGGAAQTAFSLAGADPRREGPHGGIVIVEDAPEARSSAADARSEGSGATVAGPPVPPEAPERSFEDLTPGTPAAELTADVPADGYEELLRRGTDSSAPPPAPAAPAAGKEVLRGGATIGVLERAALIGAILAGYPEAVAAIVAIKGVGRFSELADAESRERFIIGSFASLIWAAAAATAVRLLW